MKNRILALLLVAIFGVNFTARSDEGMWLPFLLGQKNYQEMKAMGLKMTPEQLYSVNNSSLKDAIVMLDGGSCTAEAISPEGLILTNHHCGFGEIQAHSTVEHDYLTDGFWAMSKNEELPNPGKKASFLVRIEDVTKRFLKELSDTMSVSERNDKIREMSYTLENESVEGTHYNAKVQPMFRRNQFYLFVYETFKDVRLVGAPPSSIGDFGGDTDNWMWPRHTGDFSMFRVYTGPDGKPAPYSEDNIPYEPKYFLPISLKGIEKGDFAMIWGYPGSTDRYLSSYGLKLKLEQTTPHAVKLEGKKLDILKEQMNKDDKVRIQYASKYAGVANYWKKQIEEAKSLKRLKVYEKKKKLEQQFQKWVEKDETRKEKYGHVLTDMEDAYKEMKNTKVHLANWYTIELRFLSGIEVLNFAYNNKALVSQLEDDKDVENLKGKLKQYAKKHFKDYNKSIDENKMAALFKMYYKNIPKAYHPGVFKEIGKKYKGDFKAYAQKVFEKTAFAGEKEYLEMLNNPKAGKIKKDPAYEAALSVFNAANEINKKMADEGTKLARSRRLFMAGLMEMMPGKDFYPDANSTMRVTYGTVKDYYPRDAVHYDWITYLGGVMQKEDPDDDEFIVPERLKEIYETKDYGDYAMGDKMPVCFLTNNDITGGNSGSPVINANGELIGAAFDGNSEAMSGDIEFDPPLQRTIVADIRYILLVIDKYAGAKHLIDEMTLVE